MFLLMMTFLKGGFLQFPEEGLRRECNFLIDVSKIEVWFSSECCKIIRKVITLINQYKQT